MKKKIPFKALMFIGWVLTALFFYLAQTVTDDRLANAFSDAFGTALAVVIIGTVSILYYSLR